MTTPDPASQTQRVGRYQLIERLAVGGMAEVFLACQRGDQSLDRLVVLKRILPHLSQNPEFVEAFSREARITARIRHPNVVQIHELGEANDLPFIAMEYVPGSTLKQLVVAARHLAVKVPLEVCVHLLLQTCAGLHAAHELVDPQGRPYGLVHRDVSPHNLMVDDAGHVKLLDFGIAKASSGNDHTRTGMLKGKISYMSPEQCRQEKLDRRSDVFALGVVAFEVIAGVRPFQAPSELATMQAIVSGRHPRLTDLRPEVPEAIATVVDRAMALRVDDRTPTADEMRRDLKRAWGQEIDADRCALFVKTLLGERHEVRRKAVEDALERTLVSFSGHPPGPPQPEPTDETGSIRPRPPAPPAVVSATVDAPPALEPPRPETRREPTRRPTRPVPAPIATLVPVVGVLGAAGGMAALAALGALILWLTQETVAEPVLHGEPVVVDLAPVMDPSRLTRDHDPIRKYLEGRLGRPVRFEITATYEQAADAVVSGQVPFAFMPRRTVRYALAAEPGLAIVAVKVVDGSISTDGYLVVRREQGAPQTLEDLRGKTLCLADPLSSTGWELPRSFLASSGIDPDTDLRIHQSGNHQAVLTDLLDGKCDAGATYSGNFNSADQRGIATARLRILAMTGVAPHDAFVASTKADPALVASLREALLAYDSERDAKARQVGDSERITGFVAPPADYATAP